MNDDASVAEECSGVWYRGEEEVKVLDLEATGCEGSGVYLAMLASQIAELTSRGYIGSAARAFVGVSDIVGVQVPSGCGAIAVFRNRVDVDVIG